MPEQVGVVGYDDGALGELISPGLTAIVQDPVKIGYTAADLLVKNIEAKAQKQNLQSLTQISKSDIHYKISKEKYPLVFLFLYLTKQLKANTIDVSKSV